MQLNNRYPGSILLPLLGVLFACGSALAVGCGSDSGRTKPGGLGGEGGEAGEPGEAGAPGSSTGGTAGDDGGTSTDGILIDVCGDGLQGDTEACDDGNLTDADGCSAQCVVELPPPGCGDGDRAGDEDCDDGNTDDGDGCDRFCQTETSLAACGDAEVQEGEGCDDGNLQSGDGCDEQCRREECGNARQDAGEECDPPARDVCSESCLKISPNCGDSTVQADEFEQCDDGNDEAADGCHLCRITCGNGRLEGAFGEQCEPIHAPAACSETCQWLPVCGDGLVQTEAGEECDPQNGVTCVACKIKDPGPPNCDGGAGGAPASDECPEVCEVLGEPGELITNGAFDTDTSAWTPHSDFITLQAISEGVPDPNALEVSFSSTSVGAVSGAYQCLPIEIGSEYEFTAEYLIPADAPSGIGTDVTVLLYPGDRCEGEWVRPPGDGPAGRVVGEWTPYSWTVGTSTLGDSGQGHMLLRLDVMQQAGTTGTRVVWDNVSLTQIGSLCGDCVVDAGESCDDGNQAAGDGCDPTCRAEVCGDAQVQTPELCDDGNNTFGEGDECTPACHLSSACDTCALAACSSGPSLLDDCWLLEGSADEGPRAGAPRSLLCDQLRSCVQRTACDNVVRNTEGVSGAFIENCYCGSAGTQCFDLDTAANGSCRDEIEAALETTDPILLFERMGNADGQYPMLVDVEELLACERSACSSDCASAPACGDGSVQDRAFDYVFRIGHEDVPCRDELTHTGTGCSFEECDDGNQTPGDGCDEYCFVEACGNNVTQAGETCDDGNRDDEDGCSPTCQIDYECGNGEVEEPIEECEPPDSGVWCTLAEYEAHPEDCGCDPSCKVGVCGNGETQRPTEQCDPPDGFSCDESCQLIEGGECEDCIARVIPDVAAFNDLYCATDPLCVAVKQCVFGSHQGADSLICAASVWSDCYCGIDANAEECRQESYEPTGACWEEIKAGEPAGRINSEILENLFSFSEPTGIAMNIVYYSKYGCAVECGLHPGE